MGYEENFWKAAVILVPALLVSYHITDFGFEVLALAVITGIIGAASFTAGDHKAFEFFQEQVSNQSGAFELTEDPFEDFDDLWNELQKWYGRDPRNGELIWQKGVTAFDTTVPKNLDGKFRFVAILTPAKGINKNIYCCVETNTRSLLTWDEKGSVNRNDLPGECSLVEDIRKKNLSTSEIESQILNGRVAQLGGGYNSFMGYGTNQSPKSAEPDFDEDDEE